MLKGYTIHCGISFYHGRTCENVQEQDKDKERKDHPNSQCFLILRRSINQYHGRQCKKCPYEKEYLRLAPSPLLLAQDEGEERDEPTAAVVKTCHPLTHFVLATYYFDYHVPVGDAGERSV